MCTVCWIWIKVKCINCLIVLLEPTSVYTKTRLCLHILNGGNDIAILSDVTWNILFASWTSYLTVWVWLHSYIEYYLTLTTTCINMHSLLCTKYVYLCMLKYLNKSEIYKLCLSSLTIQLISVPKQGCLHISNGGSDIAI